MIFRNTVAQTGAYASGMVFSFLLAPLMLAELGLALFGVWAVTGAFATYAGLVDLGVTRSVERFVALHHAQDEDRAIAETLTLGLIVVSAAGIIASLAAVAIAPVLDRGLDDVLSVGDLRAVLLASVGILILGAYRAVVSAVPLGMQQMVPPSLATIFYNVASFILSVGALLLFDGLLAYALANVVAAVLGVLAGLVALKATWGRLTLRLPSRVLVREILGYGLKTQVSWIAELLNNQADKLIIAVVIDVRAAGAYELASRAVSAVRTVALMSTSALLPAVTAQIAKEGPSAVRGFYRHYALRAMAVALPLMLLTGAIAPALLVAWLGADTPDDVLNIFVWLLLAHAFNITTAVASSVWLGDGNAGIIAVFAVVTAVANVLLTLALTPLFGMWGVIGATILSMVGSSIAGIYWFHRSYPVPLRDSLRAIGRPTALAAVAAAPIVAWLAIAGAPDGGRVTAALMSAIGVALFTAVYWPVASRMRLLPERLSLRAHRAESIPA